MPVYTDIASELYSPQKGRIPAGVKIKTGMSGPLRLTRMEICTGGLARPAGRYSLFETPSLEMLDSQNENCVNAIADELRALLPPGGPVLVVGVGNRRATADALGPRTADGIFVTRGLDPRGEWDLREVSRISPGVSADTGISLAQLLAGMVRMTKPAALLCVDSLCSEEPSRLGRSIQITDTGLCPARPQSGKSLTRAMLGVPVVAMGVPTLMEADEAVGVSGLVVTPAGLDKVVSRGAELLSRAINRALQPRLSVAELCYLAN